MSFVYYDTPNGKAYFEQTESGLNAVRDTSVLKKLQSGQLSAAQTSVEKTRKFASLPSSTPKATLPDLKTSNDTYGLPKPSAKPGDMTMFANALNKAVEMGRARRQDQDLDFLDGVIKPGMTSASNFTALLSNLNTAFDKSSETLTDAAMSQLEMQNKSIENEKNNLNDLATKLIDQGVNGETIKSILATGSLEAALPAAAEALKGKVKDAQIYSTSKGIVSVTQDENGKPVATLIFGTGGGSGASAPETVGGGFDFLGGSMGKVRQEASSVLPAPILTRISAELSDEELRFFMNDYLEETNGNQQSIDPEAYYTEWKKAAGIEQKEGLDFNAL